MEITQQNMYKILYSFDEQDYRNNYEHIWIYINEKSGHCQLNLLFSTKMSLREQNMNIATSSNCS